MSELKVYKMVGEDYCDDSYCVVPSDVYLKSEVDEELAKLNRQIEFLKTTHSSCNNCNKCADGMGRVFDESLDELKEKHKKVLAGNSKAMFTEAVKLDKELKEYGNEED